ncbi:MAG: sigma-54-dependent Fis family transcriptional regulator [Nitrospinae bacterium]|nr:sigma-54-dependent Fis family transcriptional regulator [Nitrospinota bacterium]
MSDIVVVDDDGRMRDLLVKVLMREGYTVRALPRAREVLEALSEAPTDLVISDIRMPEMDGLTLLHEVKRISPETSVILMTAFGSIDSAVQAMKTGASDYLTKPFKLDEITLVVRRVMEDRRLRAEVQALRAEVSTRYQFANIIGKSKPMLDLFALISKVANSRSTVLVQGKSGTGKELVAKAIHYNSPRQQRSLVTVNCSAIPKDLLESELFGHVRGAFTGAIASKRGLFEEADGSSLFLDEIGDLSPELQVKLLRVIQEREIKRVGDTRTLTVDVRLIAATNRDLAQAVSEGMFREDLYYRLNVIPIVLPELKERVEDIPLLAAHFLLKYGKEATPPLEGISKEAMGLLLEHGWPGNVRELENVIERAVILGHGPQILPEDLPEPIRTRQQTVRRGVDTRQLTLEELERDYIATVLREAHWHRMKAAQILGIDRRTLYRKIRTYGLQPTS